MSRYKATRGERVTSEKQARANRQNALKSTGPRTPEGKAAVRHNAVRHGLLAEEVLIAGEDEAAFADLGERLRDELQPVGELESMLVDRIIGTSWRLRRIGRVEASIFAWEHYTELLERNRQKARNYVRSQSQEDLYDYIGTSRESEIKDKEKLREVLGQAEELSRMQHADNTTLGRTFIRDADKANAFSKLSR